MIRVLLWYCLLRQGWNSCKCVGTCRSHTSIGKTHKFIQYVLRTCEMINKARPLMKQVYTALQCSIAIIAIQNFYNDFYLWFCRSRIYLWIWMSLSTLASSATTCSRLYFTAINGFRRIENIFLKWKKIQIYVCNCTTSQRERLVLSHHQLMMQIMFFQKIIHCLWCFF